MNDEAFAATDNIQHNNNKLRFREDYKERKRVVVVEAAAAAEGEIR
jgi:hypothetical protein